MTIIESFLALSNASQMFVFVSGVLILCWVVVIVVIVGSLIGLRK